MSPIEIVRIIFAVTVSDLIVYRNNRKTKHFQVNKMMPKV
jgi:hypothetical protein